MYGEVELVADKLAVVASGATRRFGTVEALCGVELAVPYEATY
jgi:hypothetical protein